MLWVFNCVAFRQGEITLVIILQRQSYRVQRLRAVTTYTHVLFVECYHLNANLRFIER